MYIKGTPEYDHHLAVYGDHRNFGYQDFIPMFKAEHFSAEEWINLIKASGAKYIMPVAEHHDGSSWVI
jgi:alpha-L-fucosidase